MRFRCKIGIHKFEFREIHLEEKLLNKKQFLASVVERCQCGTARFAPFGSGPKQTKIIISEKFK